MWRVTVLAVGVIGMAASGLSGSGDAGSHRAGPDLRAALAPDASAHARLTALQVEAGRVHASFEVQAAAPVDFLCLRVELQGPDGRRSDLAHLSRAHVDGELTLSGALAHAQPGAYVVRAIGSRDGSSWVALGAPEHFLVPAP